MRKQTPKETLTPLLEVTKNQLSHGSRRTVHIF